MNTQSKHFKYIWKIMDLLKSAIKSWFCPVKLFAFIWLFQYKKLPHVVFQKPCSKGLLATYTYTNEYQRDKRQTCATAKCSWIKHFLTFSRTDNIEILPAQLLKCRVEKLTRNWIASMVIFFFQSLTNSRTSERSRDSYLEKKIYLCSLMQIREFRKFAYTNNEFIYS